MRRAPLDLEPNGKDPLRLYADLEVGGLAGDREVPDEATGDECVGAAVLLLLGLLVGDDPEPQVALDMRLELVAPTGHDVHVTVQDQCRGAVGTNLSRRDG